MPAPSVNTNDVISFMTDGYWAGGSSLVLTYSYGGGSWTGYAPGDEPTAPGYSLFNTAQANMFVWAMETWDAYVAAEFSQSTSGPGNIRVAFTGIADTGVWGYAYLPGMGTSSGTKNFTGDIWVDEGYVGSDFAPGGYDYAALLHEIGHALGLDHSFQEDGEPITEGLPAQYDNTRYSIMSYTDIEDYWYSYFVSDGMGGWTAEAEGVNPITPMMFDILVVQDLYGKSTTMNAGATTYTFDPDQAVLQTIYDAGGVDTWNLAGHVRSSIIDLRAACFSSIDMFSITDQIEYWVDIMGEGYRTFITDWIDDPSFPSFTWEDNVAIAYGVTIENVICGEAGDSVVGNNAVNNLQGKGGADVLNGMGGNDVLAGGNGADRLIGGVGIDKLAGGGGADKFVLNAAASATNRDTIQDFTVGSDKIQLENGVFAGLTATGALSASRFWSSANGNAHDTDDRILYNSGTGALFYDADGNGGGAKVQIATLSGAPTVSASDFLVI